MSWLFNFKKDKRVASIIKESNMESEIISTSISGGVKYHSIDYEFITEMYWKSDAEKQTFIKYLSQVVEEFKFIECKTAADQYKKFSEINANAQNVPFITLIFNWLQTTITTTTYRNGKIELNEQVHEAISTGLQKLENYGNATIFYSKRIEDKILDNNKEILSEAMKVEKAINSINDFNYNRLSTWYFLGATYFDLQDEGKMEYYFNKIMSERYNLSENTVAEFYRNIGELYLSMKSSDKALVWFNEGLKLNPKLGVKNLIKKIGV